MQEYKPSTPVAISNTDSLPAAPDGWYGPFEMTYLDKPVPNPDGKGRIKAFKTFEEAVECANSLENCGGITKFSRSWQVRVGTDLISSDNVKWNAIASYTKTKPPQYDEEAETGAPAPAKVTAKVTVEPEPEPEPA